MEQRTTDDRFSPYHVFSRSEWAERREDTPMTLTSDEVTRVRSLHVRLDMAEVEEIYLPLSRLLSLYVYLDADEDVLLTWYVNRFLTLRGSAFRDPKSYFHRYATLSDRDAVETATSIWTRINLRNLHENILPTRQRADLILKKGESHLVEEVALRRL
jgi:pantothenate kinase